MRRIAEFIVKFRNLLLLLFLLAAIACVFTAGRVVVINELTDYLPQTTETRQGIDLMKEQFTTFGSAKVMIRNIGFAQARDLAESLEDIKGVSSVSFYEEKDDDEKEITRADNLRDVYNDVSALFTITFEKEEDDEETQVAIANVREALSDYDTFFYTTVDKDDSANLKADMKYILVIVVIIIILVLLFTSTTYMEIPIFMMVFGMAALLNIGTNFIFGSISFISNAVGTVLQLALAIDYAIIMFHRFMEERSKRTEEARLSSDDTDRAMLDEEALIDALSKAIVEISSSSLTTVAGMVALMFMQFGIGPDLGKVLTKAIIFSMISVFCFMPGLIMNFREQISSTMHRSFVPRIHYWGRFVVASRYVTLPLFLIGAVAAVFMSSKCTFNYDKNSVESKRMDEYLTSKREISKSFDMNNTMAILVPPGDYESEAKILSELEEIDRVENTLGMANVTVDDDELYVLTDRLSPREFSMVADIDIDACRMLYRFYAWKEEKYGAFLNGIDEFTVPLIDMIDFIYGEEENDTFDFDEELAGDIKDMHKAVSDARAQLEGELYDRLIFTVSGPVEGKETFELVDRVRDIAYQYYNEAFVVGDSTSDYDLSKSFLTDNTIISLMTALFVLIILFFTFDNVLMPAVLVLTIQTAIWVNFSIPFIEKKDMYFLSYLIVSAIQMGATIDYAIVITGRYVELRQTVADKRECVTGTLNQCFATILTSGSILTGAACVVGQMTTNCVIASLGVTLFKGTLISIILVMLILPQLLYVFDSRFQKCYWRNARVFAKSDSGNAKAAQIEVAESEPAESMAAENEQAEIKAKEQAENDAIDPDSFAGTTDNTL